MNIPALRAAPCPPLATLAGGLLTHLWLQGWFGIVPSHSPSPRPSPRANPARGEGSEFVPLRQQASFRTVGRVSMPCASRVALLRCPPFARRLSANPFNPPFPANLWISAASLEFLALACPKLARRDP